MDPPLSRRDGEGISAAGPAGLAAVSSPGPRELHLFLHALRLAWAARRIAGQRPLVRLVADLNAMPLLPRRVEVHAAVRAARRAAARTRRWLGGLDTCLVRALVAGALLSDRDGVLLHLGLLPPDGEAERPEGHAWLTVGGELVEVTGDDGSRYTEIHRLEMRRGGGT